VWPVPNRGIGPRGCRQPHDRRGDEWQGEDRDAPKDPCLHGSTRRKRSRHEATRSEGRWNGVRVLGRARVFTKLTSVRHHRLGGGSETKASPCGADWCPPALCAFRESGSNVSGSTARACQRLRRSRIPSRPRLLQPIVSAPPGGRAECAPTPTPVRTWLASRRVP